MTDALSGAPEIYSCSVSATGFSGACTPQNLGAFLDDRRGILIADGIAWAVNSGDSTVIACTVDRAALRACQYTGSDFSAGSDIVIV